MRCMSLDYSRRDCSKCKNPQELERYSAPGLFFACPDCKRRYERMGSKGIAVEGVLKALLTPPPGQALPTLAPRERRRKTGRGQR